MTHTETASPTGHKRHAIDLHTSQSAEFDQRYRDLAQDAYHSTFTYGRMKIESLIDRVIAPLPQGTRALDAGCGTGFNVSRLRQRGFSVVGLEPAEGMRRRAQAHNPGVQIIDGDIENLPFPPASFDLIVCIEVIRYLAHPARALSELARVLRPGGTAIVTAAPLCSLNGYALLNMLTARVQVPGFTKVKHSFLTEGGARRAMRDAGFAAVEVHGLFLGPWHAVGRLAPRALPALLRACEPLDDLLADRWPLRNLANHLALVGTR